jgi:hypothetical protein
VHRTALLLVAACSNDGASDADATPDDVQTSPPVGTDDTTDSTALDGAGEPAPIIAAGVFSLAAADSFESEGFHQVIELDTVVAGGYTVPAGASLVLVLRDASRPGQTCDRQHPLSGCATVDWSDFEGRSGVPPGGVFDNRTVIRRPSGERTLLLSESGVLPDAPDAYSPT